MVEFSWYMAEIGRSTEMFVGSVVPERCGDSMTGALASL